MRKTFVPQIVILGVSRRIDESTLMPKFDNDGLPLWNMPAPIRYAEHTRWHRDKKTGKRIAELVNVPVYRGTSASYARYVKSQIRRDQRKFAEQMQEIQDA